MKSHITQNISRNGNIIKIFVHEFEPEPPMLLMAKPYVGAANRLHHFSIPSSTLPATRTCPVSPGGNCEPICRRTVGGLVSSLVARNSATEPPPPPQSKCVKRRIAQAMTTTTVETVMMISCSARASFSRGVTLSVPQLSSSCHEGLWRLKGKTR